VSHFDDDRYWAQREFDRNSETQDHAARSAVDAGMRAINYCFLLNGGGCVALLGFLGATAGSATKSASPVIQSSIASLAWFGWGALASVVASGLAFGSLYLAAESFGAKGLQWSHSYVVNTTASRRRGLWFNIALAGAVLTGLSSAGFFLSGLLAARAAFTVGW